MNKHSVFKEWVLSRLPKVAPFSVGGGGPFLGPHVARNALDDTIARLRERYGNRAPNAVEGAAKLLQDTVGPSFQETPRGVVRLGRRVFGKPRISAGPRGAYAFKVPRQEVNLFDPLSPLGRDIALHEAGHLQDPMFRGPGAADRLDSDYNLRAEVAASRNALARAENSPGTRQNLSHAYGTYLQENFPLPGRVTKHMRSNPFEARVPAFEARKAAARAAYEAERDRILRPGYMARAKLRRISKRKGTDLARPQKEELYNMASRLKERVHASPEYNRYSKAERAARDARTIASRNQNTEAVQLERLRTLPAELRPQMQEWFDAQRRRIDIAFGEGAGDEALAPILEHIGWAIP